MGEATNGYWGMKLLGFSRILQEVCEGFLQDGESLDITQQKGPTFLLDRRVWNLFRAYEEKVDHRTSVGYSKHDQDLWSILWCLVSRFGLCIDVGEMTSNLCISITKGAWEELSDTWPKVRCSGICPQDLEALLLWFLVPSVQRSQELKILIWSKGVEHEITEMDGIPKRLRLWALIPS